MIGLKFGSLTSVEPISSLGSSKSIQWSCKCGKHKIIRINHVTSGRIITCGLCNLKDSQFWKTVKFGKLRILNPEPLHFNSGKIRTWICDCGNQISLSIIEVTSGKRTSCGKCNLKDSQFWKTVKFGKLRILNPEPLHLNSHTIVTWICDCGNYIDHTVVKVTTHQVQSCGKCNLINLNRKFHNLTAKDQSIVKAGSNRKITWICDCGKEVNSKIYNVVNGHTKSCGKCNLKDLQFWTTHKFGKLRMKTPELIHLNSHKIVTWICDCGNETNSKISNVTNGITKSCNNCFTTIFDWYIKNQDIIKQLVTPIKPEDIPIGGVTALEIIYKKHVPFKATCPICNRKYQPRWDMIRQGESITCGCTSNSSSTFQIEIFKFINQVCSEAQLEYTLGKFKYDIGIPHQLVVECHGLRWHSNEYSKKLDKIKYEVAINHQYTYLLIYEDEWLDKKPIFKNLIQNVIHNNQYISIRIKQCEIKQITNQESDPFYEQYHYIGKARAKVHYGVFYQNQLLACISFSKPTRQTSKYEWELIRMCSHSDYQIHGIWSKLLKLFITKYQPSSIVSFSDNRLFTGEVYKKIGFKYDGEVKSDYYWTKNKKRYHKSNLKKTNQEKSTNLTETQLRENQGFSKIWDLGKKRWVI